MNTVHNGLGTASHRDPATDRTISKRWSVEEISAHAAPGWVKRKRTAHNEVTFWYNSPAPLLPGGRYTTEPAVAVHLMASRILLLYQGEWFVSVGEWDTPTTRRHIRNVLRAHRAAAA